MMSPAEYIEQIEKQLTDRGLDLEQMKSVMQLVFGHGLARYADGYEQGRVKRDAVGEFDRARLIEAIQDGVWSVVGSDSRVRYDGVEYLVHDVETMAEIRHVDYEETDQYSHSTIVLTVEIVGDPA